MKRFKSFSIAGSLLILMAIAYLGKYKLINFLKIYQNQFWGIKYSLFNGAINLDYGKGLKATLFYPKSYEKKKFPCIIYFFGGGYQAGGIDQFFKYAEWFRSKGFATMLVDYHVELRHHTSPSVSMDDATTLMRFLHKKAESLKIDTGNVFVCGASAGGQLALSTAFSNNRQQLIPQGILLYLPVVRTTKGGWGYQLMSENESREMSPFEHLHSGFPPIIIFYGDKDETVRPQNIFEFKRKADSLNVHVEIHELNSPHKLPEGDVLNRTLSQSKEFIEWIIQQNSK